MSVKILGTGSFLPENVVTNDYLSTIMDTSDEWISSRTGIKARHLAKTESTTEMSVQAAKNALLDAGMQASELDLIIVGTVTGDEVTPSTACEVQAAIGAKAAVAFDMNAACSGFMFAMHTAYAYLQSGIYKNALIIGAETLSRIMDWNDRSTCVLFGDGAGAAVLGMGQGGILGFEQGSDGVRGSVLACKARVNNNPLVQNETVLDYVHMDGQEVYKFAVTTVPASIERVLEKTQTDVGEIKYFLLHQANIRIIQSVAKRLRAPMEKFPISLDHCGNISAASIPILLDEVNKKGMLNQGDKIVMSGFGGGLTWGTCIMEW
ncbi:MAG: ketoacyl-ACP synthase III [Lachnospiraceae bacterium]|nr:ketoacyl-ACP synthase III [Lachnospiraceae bacterium]